MRKVACPLFLGSSAVALLLAREPLLELGKLSTREELYSHIPLIPMVSAYFLWTSRKAIGEVSLWAPKAGLPLTLLGILLYLGLPGWNMPPLQPQDKIASMVFSLVVFIQGSFLLCFGPRAYKKAAFPLFFLFFLVPFPSPLEGWIVSVLQRGSTEATHLLFGLTGLPFYREGFTFQLPSLAVEVAPQCGGIRSGVALAIATLVGGKLFLETWWGRLLLLVCSLPVTVFKNGLRIVGLTLGALYIDPRILSSELHRSGGIPFFALALAMMAPLVWGISRLEGRLKRKGASYGPGRGEDGPRSISLPTGPMER
ncbi:MAG: exosortase/archaeosortase family protein [Thermodesulfobacteriota bacterium]